MDWEYFETNASFCFDKLKRYKGNNLISSRNNALGPKNMWVPKVKP